MGKSERVGGRNQKIGKTVSFCNSNCTNSIEKKFSVNPNLLAIWMTPSSLFYHFVWETGASIFFSSKSGIETKKTFFSTTYFVDDGSHTKCLSLFALQVIVNCSLYSDDLTCFVLTTYLGISWLLNPNSRLAGIFLNEGFWYSFGNLSRFCKHFSWLSACKKLTNFETLTQRSPTLINRKGTMHQFWIPLRELRAHFQ